tara:strand:+ start:354 stop:524 length:171 start_codon:yes stop_codon:yes gene_type:complete
LVWNYYIIPPDIFTLPPSEEATAGVNFVTLGSGVVTTASGIGLSLEQDKRIKKQVW